jgi:hypothetical protein
VGVPDAATRAAQGLGDLSDGQFVAGEFEGCPANCSGCSKASRAKTPMSDTAIICRVWSGRGRRQMTEAIYRSLADGAALRLQECAVALHLAVRNLRSAHPERPEIWTPFIHLGP